MEKDILYDILVMFGFGIECSCFIGAGYIYHSNKYIAIGMFAIGIITAYIVGKLICTHN